MPLQLHNFSFKFCSENWSHHVKRVKKLWKRDQFKYVFCFSTTFVACKDSPKYFNLLEIVMERISDLSDYPSRMRLFLRHPNPTFYRQKIWPYPNATFSDYWVNFMQISGHPNEISDFLCNPNPTFFTFHTIRSYLISDLLLPENFRIRLFGIRSITNFY